MATMLPATANFEVVAAGGVQGDAAPPIIQPMDEAAPSNDRIIAEPLHIQRLEASLDMRSFMNYAREVLSQPLSSSEDDVNEENDDDDDKDDATDDDKPSCSTRINQKHKKLLAGTKEERQSVKNQLFNFHELTTDREWLYEVLLSDTGSESEITDEDEYVKEMLKSYMREKKHRENFYKKPTNIQYAYYGAGLLSQEDMFPEHQQSVVGVRKRKRRVRKEKLPKLPKPKLPKMRKPRKQIIEERPEPGEIKPSDLKHYAFGDTTAVTDDIEDEDGDIDGEDDETVTDDLDIESNQGLGGVSQSGVPLGPPGKRRRRKKHARTPEVMAARRRKVWQLMAKKELGRCQRSRANNHKETILNCKRFSATCSKVVRQHATYSQKVMKETVWRAKRLTREMLGYWKRYERVERDTRRRMEREAEEQRKMDVEIIEAKRQQRKLNFLITQTELYAHFMSKKLGQGTEEEQLRILSQLDEEANPRLAAYDDYDADEMKELAKKNAGDAFDADRAKTKQFDVAAKIKEEKFDAEVKRQLEDAAKSSTDEKPLATDAKADLPQPTIFKGTLKTYQIKGMTWLANLYDQGISGILADEMGLGKTVQSIAFLCHIAERYGVWGPFLIISPASTLHNWQQEMERFAPEFRVVPYWGSPNERKILRQFWEQKALHTRDASFHVVITSYQLIVSDYKYFNRIKWQYMILDEAQAIKSSSSQRWKLLLGFNCRNRLLLSGTPIQNSMAELWALLHFIMPTLFDSHDEFNEWFSKDIESHAENKTGIDEKQISRLHMILKPFMLRRIKKDVENELSDKIEVMVYCPLTIRQKLLYMALKKKIRIEDLLNLTRGGAGSSADNAQHIDRNFTSNLMNLVMQFRKVCNHPELFERRYAKSPFAMKCEEYVMPRLLFNEALLHRAIPSKRHLLYNKFSIFKAENIQRSLFSEPPKGKAPKPGEFYARFVDLSHSNDCSFSFLRFCDLALKDVEDLTLNGLITFLNNYRLTLALYALLAYRRQWWSDYYKPTRFQLLEPMLENPLVKNHMFENSILRNFFFTGVTCNESTTYCFGGYKTQNIQETIEHRVIRSKSYKANTKTNLIEEIKQEEAEIKKEIDEDAEEVVKKEDEVDDGIGKNKSLAPIFSHVPRLPTEYTCEPLSMPRFLYDLGPKVQATRRKLYCESRAAEWSHIRHEHCENPLGLEIATTGFELCRPQSGWSSIIIPDKQTLVTDAGKLSVLDSLLTRLKAEGHRVLIYSQMTKMIDLLEEYMWHRKHRYMRLDGSSKISARRDMVADFQTRTEIFVFLLSTRAGGLGINLTAADTVIFYDSDWNPTVDQQAMDRAHRLGQTKQVTVYRLICKGTIEERILQRAREKSEIQRMVISGGNFKPDTLKPKEVVSLLLDDEEIETKYRQKAESATNSNASAQAKDATAINDKKRRQLQKQTSNASPGGITIPADEPTSSKLLKFDTSAHQATTSASANNNNNDDDSMDVTTTACTSAASSPSTAMMSALNTNETFVPGATNVSLQNDESDNEQLIVDCEATTTTGIPHQFGSQSPTIFDEFGGIGPIRRRHHPRGTKRGRPRGSGMRRGGGNGSLSRALKDPSKRTSTPIEDSQPTTTTSTTPTTESPGGGSVSAADSPSTVFTNLRDTSGSFTPSMAGPVKRGPGRPRLKTGAPISRGMRGAPRTRRPIGPLVVPIGRSPAATPLNRSPAISPAPSPAHPSSSL